MKQSMIILPMLILCGATMVHAETYRWTDEQGVVTFTDNPARIPFRYSSSAPRGKNITFQTPKTRKKLGKHPKTKLGATIPVNRIKAIPVRVRTKSLPPGTEPERKGHLGGDQTDPAPPSMKQPIPVPPGDQPIPASPGMKQPTPAPLGDQPKATPSGMKQPTPTPLGDQPTPTPLGMEQPEPKL